MIPVEVVTALLIRDGKVLMGERHEKKLYPFHWEFPGGKVESNETLLEALKRELTEELEIELVSAAPYFEDTMTYSNGITYHVTFFVVTEFIGEPQNTEFNAIGWFDAETLPSLQHLSGNKAILDRLFSEGIPAQ